MVGSRAAQYSKRGTLISTRCRRAMIHVQHLLGIGHLRRMAALARALAGQSIHVDLVSGGMPVADLPLAGVTVHQLPPVHCRDGRFDRLTDARDQPLDEPWKAHRRDRLLTLFRQLSPGALVTETFPFGRRMLRFELLPLLEAARQRGARPLIVASVRDILQPKSQPERNCEIRQWVAAYYDKILVHGDQRIATLGDTFPFADELIDKTFYTGYITEPPPRMQDANSEADGSGEVVVSGGGGAASLSLLRAAIAAKPLSSLHGAIWRLLVGHSIDQKTFAQLQRAAGSGVIVERNRPDFPALLRRCAVSVSRAGYNTVMDILTSGARAVLVPFATAGEREQTLRATLLARRERVMTICESDLTPKLLAQVVDRAAATIPAQVNFCMNGADTSAQLIAEWLGD